jgi:hypothetical protein
MRDPYSGDQMKAMWAGQDCVVAARLAMPVPFRRKQRRMISASSLDAGAACREAEVSLGAVALAGEPAP